MLETSATLTSSGEKEAVANVSSVKSIISAIAKAAITVASTIRGCALSGMIGHDGKRNVHGEVQQHLDRFANDVFIRHIMAQECVAAVISEECEDPVVQRANSYRTKYVVVLDPLDGSSNIDVNVDIGTIFSIYEKRDEADPENRTSILHAGSSQLAAGYVLYGPSTMLVFSEGHGVCGFTLDVRTATFVLSHDGITMPRKGEYYSCNEAYRDQFPEHYQGYLDLLCKAPSDEGQTYSLRYVGSLVADFHRTLLRGGVFLYPPTKRAPRGKHRLVYEANPLAFMAAQAGGMAIDGEQPILMIKPEHIHQRTPLVFGGIHEMRTFLRYKAGTHK